MRKIYRSIAVDIIIPLDNNKAAVLKFFNNKNTTKEDKLYQGN